MHPTSSFLKGAFLVGLVAFFGAGCERKTPPGAEGTEGKEAPPKGKPYTLTVEKPAPGRAGEAMTATVKVVPGGGYKMNLEFPTKLTVNGPPEADPKTRTLTAKDAAKLTHAELLLRPAFTVPKAGSYKFEGQLNFSVCTEQLCEIKTEAVTWVAAAQ
jgi:hypothetical protein